MGKINEYDFGPEYSFDTSGHDGRGGTGSISVEFRPSGDVEFYVDKGESHYDQPNAGIAAGIIPAEDADKFMEALGAAYMEWKETRNVST